MRHLDQYLDLGYSGIVLLAESDGQETVVCRDRRKCCLRLTCSLTVAPGEALRVKVMRMEMISEPRYQKTLAEKGGVLDDEKFMRVRNQRRMANIGAQHELAQLTPNCPVCGRKMQPAPTKGRWVCDAVPPCPGEKRADDSALRRYAELVHLLHVP